MEAEERRASILQRLNVVFRDVFEDDDIVVNDETTAEDVEEWDSLMHITLVISVENEFDIKMKAAEIGKLANVGALVDILMERA
jgi:acyl carrier protein